MFRPAPRLCLVLCALCASRSTAQSINIDFGLDAGTPDAEFGAASLQSGNWHALTGFEDEPVMLLNVNGEPSGVTMVRSLPFGQSWTDHPATSDAVQALFDDYYDLHSVPCEFLFEGLHPGQYQVFSYAWAPDNDNFRTSIWYDGDDANAQLVGGAWPGDFQTGITHALHTILVDDSRRNVMHAFGLVKGTLNGIQFVPQQLHLLIAPQPAAPQSLAAGTPQELVVRIDAGDESISGPVLLHHRPRPDEPFTEVAMLPAGDGLYSATLPGFECGDAPQVYVTASGTLSGGHAWPAGGDAMPHMPIVVALDGDMNGDTLADGSDIVAFVDAVLGESAAAFDLCHADFDGTGVIDPADVSGFVAVLVSQ